MFYAETLAKLLAAKDISVDDRVLVVCGGPTDSEVLSGLGFRRVLITNLDPAYDDAIDAYPYSLSDAEISHSATTSSTSSSCTRACTIAARRIARCWRCTAWRERLRSCSRRAKAF